MPKPCCPDCDWQRRHYSSHVCDCHGISPAMKFADAMARNIEARERLNDASLELLAASKELIEGGGWATGRTLDRLKAVINYIEGYTVNREEV